MVESEPTVRNEIVHDLIDAREPLLPPDIVAGLNPPCRYIYDILMLTPKDEDHFQIPNKVCLSGSHVSHFNVNLEDLIEVLVRAWVNISIVKVWTK
jgi:hypothetical protein